MFDHEDLTFLLRFAIRGLLLASAVLWTAFVFRIAAGVLTWGW